MRLLDSSGEFTAEVVTSPEGVFRFFAAPGSWTLRALSRHGNGELAVDATRGVNEVALNVAGGLTAQFERGRDPGGVPPSRHFQPR